MTQELFECMCSDDRQVAMLALAEFIYLFSEKLGGCYVSAARCRDFPRSSVTIDLHNIAEFESAHYEAHE